MAEDRDDGLAAWTGAAGGPGLDRRRLLQTALLAVGASVAGVGCDDLARTSHDAGRFFDRKAYAVLDAVAETIIPRTDTPGARDAGVPARFDAMMAHWASQATQTRFSAILREIDGSARETVGRAIAKLQPQQQLAVVEAYDRRKATDPAYLKFKGLILTLYYTSEPGATRELRYEQVPGVWEPSIKVTPETRAWAWEFQF